MVYWNENLTDTWYRDVTLLMDLMGRKECTPTLFPAFIKEAKMVSVPWHCFLPALPPIHWQERV